MTDSNVFEAIGKYNLVFVCGLYKTGTSYLTEYLETNYNFSNPFIMSNPNERGFGRQIDRYLTRECKVLRSINIEIISLQQKGTEKISNYILSIKKPAILKDPKFCFTLNIWLEKSMELGLAPFVVFTSRDIEETKASWSSAPFTRKLLEERKFARYIYEIEFQRKYTSDLKIPNVNISFKDIMTLTSRIIE